MLMLLMTPLLVVAASLLVLIVVDVLLEKQSIYEDIDPFTGEPTYYPTTLDKISQLKFFQEIENV